MLRAAGANIQVLAENGVHIFFTQVFRHNFFHADMHPGNIFVIVDDPEKPKYAAVDFGIVGTLSPKDKKYLAENFLAFFDRDYHRIAKLHLDSGWVPPESRIDQLETAVRTVCEPIFNKPLAEISFAQVLMRLFRVAQRFQCRNPAAADTPAQNPVQHRGPRQGAVPATGSLEDGKARPAGVDG